MSKSEIEAALQPGLNAEKVMKDIQKYIVSDESSYIDALVEYAEKNNIEMQLLGDIIKRAPALKAKVREDAEALRLLEKTSRLPL